jgi:hypothetical protein
MNYTSLFVAILLCSFSATAQTYKGEQDISISIGVLSGRQVADDFTHDDDGGGNYESSSSGNLFLSYKYFVSNVFALGMTIGGQNINEGMFRDGGSSGVLVEKYKLINTTLAGELTYVYKNDSSYQFYTLMGAGVSYASLYSDIQVPNYLTNYGSVPITGPRFNFQYDPFCLRAGTKLCVYFELGVGYKGIFNFGACYKLGKRFPTRIHKHASLNSTQ